ncbi:MAG: OmpA/MotB family protein [Fusobacteriota bacterium]
MPKKKCPECPPEGQPEWMATYGDMMTLLMAFFVLLFAFSSTDSQKFQTMMKAFQGALGVMEGGKTISPEKLITDTRIQAKGTEMKFMLLSKEVQKRVDEEINESMEKGEKLKQEDQEDQPSVTTEITERGLKISFLNRSLFDSGYAQIKPQGLKILEAVLSELQGIPNDIVVEGHTDNVPINTERYPSNWELSTARAVNVLKYMLENDSTLRGRIFASGYADTRPVATNDTARGRAKNRRVDIIVLKSLEERAKEKELQESLDKEE